MSRKQPNRSRIPTPPLGGESPSRWGAGSAEGDLAGPGRWRVLGPAALLVGLTLVVFFPLLENDFVNWDDDKLVTGNPIIRSLGWDAIKAFFSTFQLNHYHPVVMLSFALEHHFFGLNPMVYHATNLFLHLLNGLAVFWLFWLWTREAPLALLTALFFAIHPLRVESVAWVTERKDVLYALFFLSSLIAYLHYQRGRSMRWYGLCFSCFLLSLLSKAMAVTLPIVLLLFDFAASRKWTASIWIEKIPFAVMSGIFSVVAVISQRVGEGAKVEVSRGILRGVLEVGYVIVFYLQKTILPVRLSCLYPYGDPSKGIPAVVIVSAILTLALLTVVGWSFHRGRAPGFGALFFLITLLPVLQVTQFGAAIVADRFVYVPSIGLAFLASAGILRGMPRRGLKSRAAVSLGIALILAGMGGLTWRRCHVWKDSLTLWTDVLNQYPNSTMARNNRGNALFQQRKYAAAAEDFSWTVQVDPKDAKGWRSRGDCFLQMGEYESAIKDYSCALDIAPGSVEALINRAACHDKLGQTDQAMTDYTMALKASPASAVVHCNLGLLYNQKKESRLAITHFDAALAIDPQFPEALMNRGIAHAQNGNFQKAVSDFGQAIRLKPDYVAAYMNRGLAYGALGQYGQAAADYSEAIRFAPGQAEGYSKRFPVWVVLGQYDKAWADIHTLESLGYKVRPELIEDLRRLGAEKEKARLP